MMMLLYVLVGMLLLWLVLFLLLKYKVRRSVANVKKPPAVIDEGMVQCFSCGMVVSQEKALEKKGRYFCGVKRTDRNGVPIREEVAEIEPGTTNIISKEQILNEAVNNEQD